MTHRVQGGDVAPDFELPSNLGRTVTLHEFKDARNVVLYFYPKDETPGCIREACAFRDSYEIFKQLGAEVIGVSSDGVESHKSFAQHHALPFILLADAEGGLRKTYGVPSSFGLLPGRVTYIIDKKGIVRRVFSSQLHPDRHVDEAVDVLKSLR
ncbi:MAG: peroxiredoxin [Candidatus Bathyarchaeia archaeon]